MAILNC